MNKSYLRGFTLIELLVAIAIVALLTGIIMTNISSSRGKARDAKRISDIGQMQLGLELFFDRCKQFPVAPLAEPLSGVTCSVSGNTVMLSSYISKLPIPPTGTTYDYIVNTNRSDYFLHVTLEKSNEIVRDGMDISPQWYRDTDPSPEVLCSDDPGSVEYCLSSK